MSPKHAFNPIFDYIIENEAILELTKLNDRLGGRF